MRRGSFAAAAEPAADDHGRPVLLVQARGIVREQVHMCAEDRADAGQAHNAAVAVAAQDRLHAHVRPERQLVVAVREHEDIRVLAVLLPDLAHELRRALLVIRAVRVVHAREDDGRAALLQQPAFIRQADNARRVQQVKQRLPLFAGEHPLVVARHVKCRRERR